MDPDCCLQATCHTTSLCVGSPDPLDIIQETQLSSTHSKLQTFYERVRFLVGRDSTHVIPGVNPFDGKWVVCTSFLIAPIRSRTVFHRQEGDQPKEHSPTSYIHACFSDSSVALSQRHSSWHTNCGISGGFVTGRMTVTVPKDFPSSCFLFHFRFSSLITCEGLSPYLHPTYFHIFLIQANCPLGV